MTTGFILLGVGISFGVSAAVLDSDETFNTAGEDDYVLDGLTAVGAIMGTAGLVMGVTGIIMKSVSGAQRRRWERKYGATDATLPSLSVTPTLSPDGTGGLAVFGRF